MSGTSDTAQNSSLAEALRLRAAGHPVDALTCLSGAEDLNSRHLRALLTAEIGQSDNSINQLTVLLGEYPGFHEARINLGRLLLKADRREELDSALSPLIRRTDTSPQQDAAAGKLLSRLNHDDSARPLLIRAVERGMGDADLLTWLGKSAWWSNHPVTAKAAYEAAARLLPPDADPARRFGIIDGWANVCLRLGLYTEAAPTHVPAALEIGDPGALSVMIYALTRSDDHDGPAQDRIARAAADRIGFSPDPPTITDPDPERKLRIGYFGSDLGLALTDAQVTPFIRRHDRDRYEPVLFSTRPIHANMFGSYGEDDIERHDLSGLSVAQIDQYIRDRSIDILIDIAAHTMGPAVWTLNRKPAPVLVSFYYSTTGLSGLDGLFTDPITAPERDGLYREPLIELPVSWLPYVHPKGCDAAIAPPPHEKNGHITFGSFNDLSKITPRTLRFWRHVLDAFPGARMVVKNKLMSVTEVATWFKQRLRSVGIDPNRITILGTQPPEQHRQSFARIDLMLDCLPYNGSLTTAEALYHGVPVATVTGNMMHARMSTLFQRRLGLEEVIAETETALIEKLRNLMADQPKLRRIRYGLRQKMQNAPFADIPGYTRALECELRRLWRQKCEDTPR